MLSIDYHTIHVIDKASFNPSNNDNQNACSRKEIKRQSFSPAFFGLRPALTPAVLTEPLFWQLFFIKAVHMKPLPLAVGIFAHDHLSKGGTPAVAIFRLVGIVLPLTALQTLSRGFFPSFLLEPAFLIGLFINAAQLEFLLQFLSGLVDEVVESLRDRYLLLRLRLHLILNPDDMTIFLINFRLPPSILLLSPPVQPPQEGLSPWLKLQPKFLYLLIQLADLSQKGISLRRYHVESVNKIIHIAHPVYLKFIHNIDAYLNC